LHCRAGNQRRSDPRERRLRALGIVEREVAQRRAAVAGQPPITCSKSASVATGLPSRFVTTAPRGTPAAPSE
jgi:hypothetical protein